MIKSTLYTSIHSSVILAALYGSCLIPDISQAKESAGDSVALEEIIVTARKRAESLQNTPIAVSAFSAQGLEDRGISNISQIEQFTPNLVFDTSEGIGGGSSAQVFIRGIGQSDFTIGTEPGVGIYLDGVYIGRTPGAVLDLMDLERVEVLRGPQGTLFGRNTIGGAISLINQRPSDEFGGRMEVTGGTDNHIDAKAVINIPLSDTFRTKFTGLTKNQDGFVRNLTNGQKLGDVNILAGRFAVDWDPSPEVNIRFSVDGSRQRQAGAPTTGIFFDDTFLAPGTMGPPTDSGQPFFVGTIAGFYNSIGQNGVPGVIPPPPAGQDIFGQSLVNANGNCAFALGAAPVSDTSNPNCFNSQYNTGNLYTTYGSKTENNTDVYGLSLIASWDMTDNLSFKSITAYRNMKARFTNDIDNSPLPVGETENNIRQHQFSEEIQFTGIYQNLKWVTGLYYYSESASDSGQITTGSGNFLNGSTIKNNDYAAFGQLTIDLTDRLSLTAGGRYTREDKDFLPQSQYVTAFFIPAPFFNLPENAGTAAAYGCPTNPDGSGVCFPGVSFLPGKTQTQSVSQFKPLVNLSFQVTEDILTYLTYSQGFKSGGSNQRAIFPSLDPSFLLYGPEFATVYEGGIKASFLDNRMRLNGAVFQTNYSNIQTNVQVGFVPTVQNAGDAKITGFELEWQARPTENLKISATLSHLDARYTRVSPNANVTLDSHFVNSPAWSASAGLAYIIDLPAGHTLTPRIDWTYSSRTYNDADNNPELAQDALHLINAGLRFDSADQKWSLALDVKNLTNKAYIVAGFRNAVGGFGQAIVARKRQWSLKLIWHF